MGATLVRGAGCFECPSCHALDVSEWLECVASQQDGSSAKAGLGSSRRRRAKDANGAPWNDLAGEERLEELSRELFRLHDLNSDGVLEEEELIKLNQKIAVMHRGADVDINEIRSKYRDLFRAKLDPYGNPVGYEVFRSYVREVLSDLDRDPEAQEMIMEQLVVEAQTGRQVLNLESLLREPDFPLKAADFPRVLQKVVAEMEIREWSQSDVSFSESMQRQSREPGKAAGPGFDSVLIDVESEWRYLDRP